MKKIFYLSAVLALWFGLQVAFAECPTGYACLLRDIKNQDSIIRNVQKEKVNEYYKIEIKEPKNKEQDKEIIPPYRQLLPFSPRYY